MCKNVARYLLGVKNILKEKERGYIIV